MQVHSMRLRYWAIVTGFALVPVTKVPYGLEKQPFHMTGG
jgi:hypothetical protein